ncbi:hypothetical protein ACLQ24_05660 [Micromonospora sp. DT4]|uniref:hypothetical protein n=1 Tax=Micromonospora sp. DT4 TaxID=3393438 RepID=UPI003CEF3CE0
MPLSRTFGSITATALTDGEGAFFQLRDEAFPHATAAHWAEADRRHPTSPTAHLPHRPPTHPPAPVDHEVIAPSRGVLE